MYQWDFPYRARAYAEIERDLARPKEEKQAEIDRTFAQMRAEREHPEAAEVPDPPVNTAAYPNPLPLYVVDAFAYPFRTMYALMAMDLIWTTMKALGRMADAVEAGDTEGVSDALGEAQRRLQSAIDEIVWHEYHLTGNPDLIAPVLKRLAEEEWPNRRRKRSGTAKTGTPGATRAGRSSPSPPKPAHS
jgi:hypothetical protein